MRARRAFRSSMPAVRHRMAITSQATVMSKPLSRGTPSERLPSPMTMLRRARSFMSSTRRSSTRWESMPRGLPWCRELSSRAHNRLLAAPIASMSPVNCRLRSSIGSTWA